MISKCAFLFLLIPCFAKASSDTSIVKLNTVATMILQMTTPAKQGSETEINVVMKNRLPAEWTGYLLLELADAKSGENIDGLLANIFPNQYFTVGKDDSTEVLFPITIPHLLKNDIAIHVKCYRNNQICDSIQTVLRVIR